MTKIPARHCPTLERLYVMPSRVQVLEQIRPNPSLHVQPTLTRHPSRNQISITKLAFYSHPTEGHSLFDLAVRYILPVALRPGNRGVQKSPATLFRCPSKEQPQRENLILQKPT